MTKYIISIASIIIIAYLGLKIPHLQNKATLDEPFTLKINQATIVDDLKLTLLSITEDSRCPTNVKCVSEGFVKAKIKINKNNLSPIREISTQNKNHRFEDYNITIKKVEPKPIAGLIINQSKYKITFTITK